MGPFETQAVYLLFCFLKLLSSAHNSQVNPPQSYNTMTLAHISEPSHYEPTTLADMGTQHINTYPTWTCQYHADTILYFKSHCDVRPVAPNSILDYRGICLRVVCPHFTIGSY